MTLHMSVESLFIENRTPCDIDQNRVMLHPRKLPFPDEPSRSPGEWQADNNHIALAQHSLEIAQRPNKVCRLGTGPAGIDRIDAHAKGTHEPGCSTSNPSIAENT